MGRFADKVDIVDVPLERGTVVIVVAVVDVAFT